MQQQVKSVFLSCKKKVLKQSCLSRHFDACIQAWSACAINQYHRMHTDGDCISFKSWCAVQSTLLLELAPWHALARFRQWMQVFFSRCAGWLRVLVACASNWRLCFVNLWWSQNFNCLSICWRNTFKRIRHAIWQWMQGFPTIFEVKVSQLLFHEATLISKLKNNMPCLNLNIWKTTKTYIKSTEKQYLKNHLGSSHPPANNLKS